MITIQLVFHFSYDTLSWLFPASAHKSKLRSWWKGCLGNGKNESAGKTHILAVDGHSMLDKLSAPDTRDYSEVL